MGIKYDPARKSNDGKPLIPVEDFREQDVAEAVKDRQVHKHQANRAVLTLLGKSADLLTKHRLVVADYERPGQTMSGLKKRFDRMVESDAEWWDWAKENGMQPDNPRPGTPTKTPSAAADGAEAKD